MDDMAWTWTATILRSSMLLAIASGVMLVVLRAPQSILPRTQLLAWVFVLIQGWMFAGISVSIPWFDPPAEEPAFVLPELPSHQLGAAALDGDTAALPGDLLLDEQRPIRRFSAWKLLGLPLLCLWGSGLVIGLCLYAYRYAQLLTRLNRLGAAAAAPIDWEQQLQQIAKELQVGCSLQLIATPSLGPLVCRLPGRYVVIVPRSDWRQMPIEQRAAILRHELIHVRRGDVWKTLFVRILALPQWFNPLAWIAVRRFDDALEMACDDAARGESDDDRLQYAKALYSLATIERQRLPFVPAATGGSLSVRVRRILNPSRMERKMTRMFVLCSLAALATLGVLRVNLTAKEPTPQATKANEDQPQASKEVDKAKVDAATIENGGFEEAAADSADPARWYATRLKETEDFVVFQHETGGAQEGNQSVSIKVKEGHPEKVIAYNWVAPLTGWRPGETYEVSGWLKTKNVVESPLICVQCINREQRRFAAFATTQGTHKIVGDSDWRKVTASVTIPAETSEVSSARHCPQKATRAARRGLMMCGSTWSKRLPRSAKSSKTVMLSS